MAGKFSCRAPTQEVPLTAWLSVRRRVPGSTVWLLVHLRHVNQTLQSHVLSHVILHQSRRRAGKQVAYYDSTRAHTCAPRMQLRTQQSASHIPDGQLVNAGHTMQL